ncbi:MAG: GNAT family N-acetyltransferase [Caldilineaceae bacterium]
MSSHHTATHHHHGTPKDAHPSTTGTIHYRAMQPHDAEAVCHLVAKVFCAHVAPHFAPEGVAAFLQYLRPTELWKRIHHEHFVLVAEDKSGLVGMIEMRDYNHVALLFVAEGHQKQGIARCLVELAVKECQRHNPELTELTVGATPNAVPVYERLGFAQVRPDHWENGMHTFPMALPLATLQHESHELHRKA